MLTHVCFDNSIVQLFFSCTCVYILINIIVYVMIWLPIKGPKLVNRIMLASPRVEGFVISKCKKISKCDRNFIHIIFGYKNVL